MKAFFRKHLRNFVAGTSILILVLLFGDSLHSVSQHQPVLESGFVGWLRAQFNHVADLMDVVTGVIKRT